MDLLTIYSENCHMYQVQKYDNYMLG